MSQQRLLVDDISDNCEKLDSSHSTYSAAPLEHPPAYDVSVGVKTLLDSAVVAFAQLEPWCHAAAEFEKDHPILRTVIAHLKKQAHRYFDAINKSINCSDQGVVFSILANDLYLTLRADDRETKTSDTDILNFIKRMETELSKAQKNVEETRAQFIDVQEQLIKYAQRIPQQKEAVERDEQGAQRAGARWKITERCATWIIAHLTLDDGAMTFIASLNALPHVGIILPVIIPVAVIAARITAEGVRGVADLAIENREKHVVRCQDALPKLEEISGKINVVIKSINDFAEWWQEMRKDLQDIKAQVISKGDFNKIATQVHRQLVCLGGPFQEYSSQIEKLQDFYPASYKASGTHRWSWAA